MVAGNYVVRFKYGNKESNIYYNGQDYKNTAYQVNMLNEDGTSTLDNEWQDLRTSTLNDVRISDARDYELQRMYDTLNSNSFPSSLYNEIFDIFLSRSITVLDLLSNPKSMFLTI